MNDQLCEHQWHRYNYYFLEYCEWFRQLFSYSHHQIVKVRLNCWCKGGMTITLVWGGGGEILLVMSHIRAIVLCRRLTFHTMLKSVSLWNHSGIVCDITPLQNFFFDIILVLSKIYVAGSKLSSAIFMHGRCQLIKTFVNKEVTCYFSPIPSFHN